MEADDELLAQLSREDLIARIRSLEAKNRKLLLDNGSMTKDLNHQLAAIQQLKAANFQLVAGNSELREMVCHLDDERSRSKAMAREWQSFGTHMSRVMRHEVTSYSQKLVQLEAKQFELVRENFELKQLCLLLDDAIASRHKMQQILQYIRSLEHKLHLQTDADSDSNNSAECPPAVAEAMRVLRIQESLGEGEEGEKALVRSLCNVAWRKIEEQ